MMENEILGNFYLYLYFPISLIRFKLKKKTRIIGMSIMRTNKMIQMSWALFHSSSCIQIEIFEDSMFERVLHVCIEDKTRSTCALSKRILDSHNYYQGEDRVHSLIYAHLMYILRVYSCKSIWIHIHFHVYIYYIYVKWNTTPTNHSWHIYYIFIIFLSKIDTSSNKWYGRNKCNNLIIFYKLILFIIEVKLSYCLLPIA